MQPNENNSSSNKFFTNLSVSLSSIILGIVAVALLFPSWSKLSVFANVEFFFTEAVGLLVLCILLLQVALRLVEKYIFPLVRKKKILFALTVLATVSTSIVLLMLAVTYLWIRFEVQQVCYAAEKQYGGGCIAATLQLLQDEKQDFRSRNDAIWTLGQLGDSRALPVLESMYTGEIPDREPLDETISQYELKKAIALTSGEGQPRINQKSDWQTYQFDKAYEVASLHFSLSHPQDWQPIEEGERVVWYAPDKQKKLVVSWLNPDVISDTESICRAGMCNPVGTTTTASGETVTIYQPTPQRQQDLGLPNTFLIGIFDTSPNEITPEFSTDSLAVDELIEVLATVN